MVKVRFRPRRLAAAVAAVVAVTSAGMTAVVVFYGRGDRICKGVTVSGVQIGGLAKKQAARAIRAYARERTNRGVVLTALDCRWTGTPAAFGARVEWQKAIDDAFAVGREGNIVHRAVCVLTSGGAGKRIRAETVLDPSQLKRTLDKVAKAVNRPYKDASIKVVDDRLEIEQDAWGIKLNEQKAATAISTALVSGQSVVSLPVEADKPSIAAQDAMQIDTLLARYTTPFNPGKRDRSHNLKLAAEVISGIILKPGHRFSYNAVVGPRVGKRGYKSAPIFVRGELEPGVGGGVCQVSSTLYNSVLLAGLKVVERHRHSRTVPYVRAGRDATVAYGWRDFKFENSNSSPICVMTKVAGARLTIDIYGAAKDKKKIEIFTGGAKRSARGETTVVDNSLKPGAKKVVDKGSSGVSVTVYRKVTAPDGSSETQVVSKDRYPARDRIVAVGPSTETTKKPSVQPAAASPRASTDVAPRLN